MKNSSYKKIFISYRVQDTAGETGRLVDDLKQSFADEQLFMDIENLEPGADFVETIEKSLDTCDVFLAVIGPHWAGPSGVNRINDPNDWVRMEVSTALRRNIRVVPVLVDGAALPKQEDLPPDLHSLLRRQAIEISNKRWRYDTDQLIQFLINSAGIPPLKKQQQPFVPAPPAQKKSKTWVWVGAGFLLAIVVLGIIGSMMEEKKPDGTTTQKTTQKQEVLPINAESEQNSSQSNTNDEYTETNATANITGTWQEIDEGVTSMFVFTQNGNNIGVQVGLNGEVIGTGSGQVNNRTVNLNFLLMGLATTMTATLSDDGNTINGSYNMSANNTTKPIQLRRVSR